MRISTHRPNIYLIGFMGTGKTTAGRMLSKRLRYTFIDTDKAIAEKEASPVKAIIEEKGLPYFREREVAFIESGHPAEACIISCGGGLVTNPGMMNTLKEHGLVIALFASVETLLERTGRNDKRPLLNVENPRERIEALLEERTDLYKQAHVCISTDMRSISDVAQQMGRTYDRFVKQMGS